MPLLSLMFSRSGEGKWQKLPKIPVHLLSLLLHPALCHDALGDSDDPTQMTMMNQVIHGM